MAFIYLLIAIREGSYVGNNSGCVLNVEMQHRSRSPRIPICCEMQA